MQKVRLLLPAYNEELSLPSLLNRIAEMMNNLPVPLDVIVVNDGSKDKTLTIVEDLAQRKGWIKVLNLQPNRGLAGALRAGFKEATKDLGDNDIIVTMDADDSHHPALIVYMIQQIEKGRDIIIASRYRKGSKVVGLSMHRKFLSTIASYMFVVFKPIPGVRDYTCGFRAYRVGLLRKADKYYSDNLIQQHGFGCMAELLIKLKIFNPEILEVPFVLHYDLKQGVSKMNITKTVLQTLKLIFA
jgi:dolichol-phosphate mannosyltransferase